MAWLLLFFALLFLAGISLQVLVQGKESAVRGENLAAALPLGGACHGFVVVSSLVFLDRFPVACLAWLPACLLAAAAVRAFLDSRKARSRPAPSMLPDVQVLDGKAAVFADFAFLLAAGLFTALLMAIAYKDGLYADALYLWGFKSLVLAEEGSLRVPAFMDGDFFHHHKDYPLLFPSLQALLYRISGELLDRTAKMLYPILLFATSAFLYFHVKRRWNAAAGFTAGSLCLATPALCGFHPGICSAYMDVPLGCLLAFGVLLGLQWLREGGAGQALLAGLFLSAAALTKNEGLAAAAFAALLLVGAALRRGLRPQIQGAAALLLPLAVFAGAWMIFRGRLPEGEAATLSFFTEGGIAQGMHDLPKAAGRYTLELIHFERFGFLWLLALVLAPWWMRKEGKVAGLFLAGMILIHVAAVAFSPLEISFQAASTVFRLPGQLAPLAAACGGIGLGILQGYGSAAGRTPSGRPS